MENETITSPRRRQILNLLASRQPLSRLRLAEKLKPVYPVSKATLARDLQWLIKQGLIKAEGVGKSTVYLSRQHPLLGLVDRKQYFNNPDRFDSVKRGFDFGVFQSLEQLEDFKLELSRLSEAEKRLDPTIFKREIERFIVEFAWKSSRIEGNTYTLLETDILIRQLKEAEGHSREEAQMILNHKTAVDYILKNRREFAVLSQEKVVKLHKLLVGGLEISVPIRSHAVSITGTAYLPLREKAAILKALRQTIDRINKVKEPLLKAFIASFMIAYIQPFSDGNKRTGRVLTNAILIAHDLYPLSYRDVKEIDYLESMVIFYEQNNLYHLKKIFAEQLEFSRENYFRT